MTQSAVALFAFNRPETTARVFEAVRAARPKRLLLVCDGARAEREGEAERCAEVRRIVESVDWPCDVERDFSSVNLGCGRRIASGIEWVFSRVDEAIFLEDDTLPHETFFPYCDELLARYRDDERVLMVSGYNMLGRGSADGASYWFSTFPRIWGWASWRRAWRGYDVTMAEWPAFKATPEWRERSGAEQRAYEPFLDAVKDGAIDTWDAQVLLLAWRTRRLTAIPATNLVTNLGFGAASTHTASSEFPGPAVVGLPLAGGAGESASVAGAAGAAELRLALRHPADVQRQIAMDEEWLRLELPERANVVTRAFQRAANWVRGQ